MPVVFGPSFLVKVSFWFACYRLLFLYYCFVSSFGVDTISSLRRYCCGAEGLCKGVSNVFEEQERNKGIRRSDKDSIGGILLSQNVTVYFFIRAR